MGHVELDSSDTKEILRHRISVACLLELGILLVSGDAKVG